MINCLANWLSPFRFPTSSYNPGQSSWCTWRFLTISPFPPLPPCNVDIVKLYPYINNKLLWARKYARIVVRGYCLFREANSCPRAKLEGNCELRGTDNVQGQLFVHISEAKSSLLSLLSFTYFLSQRKQRRNKTKQTTKQNTSTSWSFLALLSQQVSRVSSSVNWRKTLHFEVCYWLWPGIIGW